MIFVTEENGQTVPEIVQALAEANYDESGVLQDVLKLKVKESLYVNSPDVRVFTMRDEDAALVGYAVYFVTEHPHFDGTLFAFNDVIYIKPEYRTVYAANFFSFCEEHLDVKVIYQGMNYTKPHAKLMESLGYVPTEIMYHKVVS